MSDQTKSIPEHIRIVMSARAEHPHSYAEIFAALRERGVDTVKAREAIQEALRYLSRCGFAAKFGKGDTATFQATGQGMKRPRLPTGEAQRRRLERDKLRKQSRRPAAAPRERRVDANTVSRPKVKKAAPCTGPAETVEQFRARGGRVERLPTHWEQAA